MEDFLRYQLIVWVWPMLGALGLGTAAYFAQRFARAQEKTGQHQRDVTELRQRMESIEEALDASQRDVARLETAQAFTNRLLTERVPTQR